MIPDFKWEEFQMRKHQSSLRLCWRRYCKRAAKQGLKAYSWASFVFFYGQFRTTTIECKEKIISVLTDNTDPIILQERTNRITSVSDDIQTIYLRKGLTNEKL